MSSDSMGVCLHKPWPSIPILAARLLEDDNPKNIQTNIFKEAFTDEAKTTPTGMNIVYGELNNPLAINLYVLSYDKNNHLIRPNELILKNLKTTMLNFQFYDRKTANTEQITTEYFSWTFMYNFYNSKQIIQIIILILHDIKCHGNDPTFTNLNEKDH